MGKYKCHNWERDACYYVLSEKYDITYLVTQKLSKFCMIII